MDSIAKNHTHAQMVESGTQLTNSVFAPIDPIGVDIVAFQSLTALEANTSIQLFQNVSVCQDSSGTVEFVSNAITVGYGMLLS